MIHILMVLIVMKVPKARPPIAPMRPEALSTPIREMLYPLTAHMPIHTGEVPLIKALKLAALAMVSKS